jgi:hypothetical protein
MIKNDPSKYLTRSRLVQEKIKRRAQSYAKPDGEAHVSHTAVAERYGLEMCDPFTRVFVAALYWQERAEFWKRKAQESA